MNPAAHLDPDVRRGRVGRVRDADAGVVPLLRRVRTQTAAQASVTSVA